MTHFAPAAPQVKLLGREPTLWLNLIGAMLGFFVTFGWDSLTATQAASIIAVLTAILGAVNAALVRPVAPAAFTAVVTAGATLLAAYGLDFSQERVGMVQMMVIGVLALVTRHQVTPTPPSAPVEV